MSLRLRRSNERGFVDHGWLKSFHSFSFADYWDPQFMGFHSLRVINEDRVAPGQGFGTHGHKDMEIITYVLNGALAHKDSLGNGSTIQPGDVQYMSAGQGVTHSEFNPDPKTESHFVQIWIQPSEIGAEPRYDQKHFDKRFKLNKLGLIAGPPGSGPLSLEIRQDAKILASILETGKKLSFSVSKNRAGYLQVLRGKVDLQGLTLNAGDAVFIDEPTESSVTGKSEMSELLFFDLSTRSNSMKKE